MGSGKRFAASGGGDCILGWCDPRFPQGGMMGVCFVVMVGVIWLFCGGLRQRDSDPVALGWDGLLVVGEGV